MAASRRERFERALLRLSVAAIWASQFQHEVKRARERGRRNPAASGGAGGGATLGSAASASNSGQALTQGFSSSTEFFITQSVLEVSVDVMEAYLREMGRVATGIAELAGRTRMNLDDVLEMLEIVNNVSKSSIRDMAMYESYEEVAFPGKVPNIPVPQSERKRNSREERGRKAELDDCDRSSALRAITEGWMPKLPAAHTYIATPIGPASDSMSLDFTVQARRKRQIEKSLIWLKEQQEKTGVSIRCVIPWNPCVAGDV
mmetsp:Transcript_9342/g.19112  ORF Transcript_9342/g.19112 Transcript_9342/m.19112 type:complete len:260 (-) Transcript_9342:2690-3469(-)